MYGQYNSYRNDLNVTVSQSLAFPTVYMNLAELAKANMQSSELNRDVVKNELIYNVKQTWYQLLFFADRQRLLENQDSIYAEYYRAASVRYKMGESNYLEQITAETQLFEIRNRMFQNKADIDITLQRMAVLINSRSELVLLDSVLVKRPLVLTRDSTAVSDNPALAYMKQKISVHEKQKKVERSRLLPDWNVGYFNQSLSGYQENDQRVSNYYGSSNRFQGVMVGVSIPLWARAQAARIKAADFGVKIAETQYDVLQRNIEGQYQQLVQEYFKYSNSLTYYEKNLLPQADLILTNAQKAYRSGEINYVEYMSSLNKALTARTDYLNLLNQYNQSVINIEFIIGNN
jgi:cobalt-zinc-cadmium resistance protein CzcA